MKKLFYSFSIVYLGVLIIDPITHGLIGAAITGLSGHSLKLTDPIILGCVLGAMAPDLDIVTHVKGRLNYLLKHRGASHSLLALGGIALSLGSIVHFIFPTSTWLTVVFWTLVGTLSHGLVDLLNSYGAQLLWPFHKKKFTVNMAMLSDPMIFLIFLANLIASLIYPQGNTYFSIAAVLVALVYLFLREMDRYQKKKKLESYFKVSSEQIKVLPAIYKPFSWAFLLFRQDKVIVGILKKKEVKILKELPQWDAEDPLINHALEGGLADIFAAFTPYFHVMRVDDGSEARIKFFDLRYWDKGDFLYTGEVRICPDGKIAEERFYSFGNKNAQGIVLDY